MSNSFSGAVPGAVPPSRENDEDGDCFSSFAPGSERQALHYFASQVSQSLTPIHPTKVVYHPLKRIAILIDSMMHPSVSPSASISSPIASSKLELPFSGWEFAHTHTCSRAISFQLSTAVHCRQQPPILALPTLFLERARILSKRHRHLISDRCALSTNVTSIVLSLSDCGTRAREHESQPKCSNF